MIRQDIQKAAILCSLTLAFGLAGCGDDQRTTAAETPAPSSQTEQQPSPSSASNASPAASMTYTAPGRAWVMDAKQGQALAADRREATPIDPRGLGQRYPVRVEPITWDYGQCTNARTLIPPPLEGWGLLNDTSVGEWPIADDNARIVLTRAGDPHDPATLGRAASNDATSIYISSGTPTTKALQDMFSNEQLRPAFFTPGPYNYPVRKGVAGQRHQEALLGPYRVLIDGNNADNGAYFRQIIHCAIKSGLIAPGADPATLRATP